MSGFPRPSGGTVTFSGDLTGTAGGPQTVVGLQTEPVSAATPAASDSLVFTGTEWAPNPAPATAFPVGPLDDGTNTYEITAASKVLTSVNTVDASAAIARLDLEGDDANTVDYNLFANDDAGNQVSTFGSIASGQVHLTETAQLASGTTASLDMDTPAANVAALTLRAQDDANAHHATLVLATIAGNPSAVVNLDGIPVLDLFNAAPGAIGLTDNAGGILLQSTSGTNGIVIEDTFAGVGAEIQLNAVDSTDTTRATLTLQPTAADGIISLATNLATPFEYNPPNLTVAAGPAGALDLVSTGGITATSAGDAETAGGGVTLNSNDGGYLATVNVFASVGDDRATNGAGATSPSHSADLQLQASEASGPSATLILDGTALFALSLLGISTTPTDSHTATGGFAPAFGAVTQNNLGYDVLVNISQRVATATAAVLNVGVGPTNPPTVDPATAAITGVGVDVSLAAVVPAGYFVNLTTTGTVMLGTTTVVVTPL